MSFIPGQIVAQAAHNFRAQAIQHQGRIHPEIYRALSKAEHLMIVEREEGTDVWVYHVDKKPDGWDQPADGRVLRRVKIPTSELRPWHVQPVDPVSTLARAIAQCEQDLRPQYIPAIFDCQTWVYQCAELTDLTPSQQAKAELTARGVNYMEQGMRLYGGRIWDFIAPTRPSQ